jgi:hypothetical protein
VVKIIEKLVKFAEYWSKFWATKHSLWALSKHERVWIWPLKSVLEPTVRLLYLQLQRQRFLKSKNICLLWKQKQILSLLSYVTHYIGLPT